MVFLCIWKYVHVKKQHCIQDDLSQLMLQMKSSTEILEWEIKLLNFYPATLPSKSDNFDLMCSRMAKIACVAMLVTIKVSASWSHDNGTQSLWLELFCWVWTCSEVQTWASSGHSSAHLKTEAFRSSSILFAACKRTKINLYCAHLVWDSVGRPKIALAN